MLLCWFQTKLRFTPGSSCPSPWSQTSVNKGNALIGCMLTQILHSIKIGQSTSTMHFQSLLHFWHNLEAKYEFSEGFSVIKFSFFSIAISRKAVLPSRVIFTLFGSIFSLQGQFLGLWVGKDWGPSLIFPSTAATAFPN